MWVFKEIKQALQKYHDGLVFDSYGTMFVIWNWFSKWNSDKTSPINCPGSTHSINHCFFHVLFLFIFFSNSLHKLFVQSCISFDGNNAFFTTGLQNGAQQLFASFKISPQLCTEFSIRYLQVFTQISIISHETKITII